MNKKGVDMRLLTSMLILVLIIIVSALFIKKYILDKGDDVEQFSACDNLPLGDASCAESKEACENEDGEVAPGEYNCEGVCCIKNAFS